jgi:hypothetical protein
MVDYSNFLISYSGVPVSDFKSAIINPQSVISKIPYFCKFGVQITEAGRNQINAY